MMTAKKGMNALTTTAFMLFTLSFSILSATGPSYFMFASANDGEYEEEQEHDSIEAELGEHSQVELELSVETEVEIEIHEEDLADGEYSITFNCTDPEISQTFTDHLEVVEGQGELEHHLELPAGMYEGCALFIGRLSVAFDSFTIVEVHEEEHEEQEDDAEHDDEDHEEASYTNEDGYVRIEKDLGEHSEVHFKAEGGSARVMVEIEEGDLQDGRYNVTLACGSPDSSLTFSEKLVVTGGEGEFEGKLTLGSATYSDCMVSVGSDLSVMLPDFTIVPMEDDHHGHDDEGEHRTASRVYVKHDGIVRFEAMVNHPGFEPGTYDVLVTCEEPAGLSMPFNDAFVMDEDGKGKFRAETTLGARSYSGCEASIEEESGRMVIATFDPFRVEEMSHEDDGDERTIDEKRKERRHAILDRILADDIHRRHVDAARASSTGQYQPGMAYNLTAVGTVESHDNEMTVAEVNADVGVWKSNRAIVLMDVLGGSVVVGDDSYTVRVGYALYSLQHDVLRLRALATDDATGEIVSLKLLGAATSDDATFPMADGEVMELQFEGNSDRFSNQIGSWELFLDGTIEA